MGRIRSACRVARRGERVCLLPALLSVALFGGDADARLRLRWQVRVREATGNRIQIAASGDRIFFDDFYNIPELDARTGRRRGAISSGDCSGFLTDLRVHAGLLLSLCQHPGSEERSTPLPIAPRVTLRVVDLGRRRLLWERDGQSPAPLAPTTDRLLLLDGDTLRALELRTGRELWSRSVAETGIGPTTSAGLVLVQRDGAVQAFALASGKPVWGRKLPGRPLSPLTAAEGQLFVAHLLDEPRGRTSGRFFALAAATGKTRWSREFPGEELFFSPTVAGGTVLLPTMGDDASRTDSQLHALSASDGRTRWKRTIVTDANGHDFSPVLVDDQVVLWSGDLAEYRRHAVSMSYALQAFDLISGASLWSHPAPRSEKFTLSTLLVVGRRLVFSDEHRVYGFELPRARRPRPRGERQQPADGSNGSKLPAPGLHDSSPKL